MESSKPAQINTSSIAPGRAPLYMEAARLIKQRIKHGEYAPNTLLPSIRQLSKALGLSHNAVQRAIQQLETERIVTSQHGVGVKILAGDDCQTTAHWIALVQPYHSLASVTLQRGLEQAMEDRSNFCVVKTSDNDNQRERQIIDHLIDNGINGLLLWPVDNERNADFLNQVVKRVPTVLLDRQVTGVEAPVVVHDYDAVGREMVDYLVKKQCQKILVICDPVSIPTFEEWKTSIREQCQKHGIAQKLELMNEPVLQIINQCQDGDFRLARQRTQALGPMLRNGMYDAIICPQQQYLKYVLCDDDLLDVTEQIPILTFEHAQVARDDIALYRPNMAQWTMDQLALFRLAINLLDQTMIKGSNRSQVLRIKPVLSTWQPPQ